MIMHMLADWAWILGGAGFSAGASTALLWLLGPHLPIHRLAHACQRLFVASSSLPGVLLAMVIIALILNGLGFVLMRMLAKQDAGLVLHIMVCAAAMLVTVILVSVLLIAVTPDITVAG